MYQLNHPPCYCQLQTSLNWPSRLSEWHCKLYRQPRLIVIPRIFSVKIRGLLCQRSYSPATQFLSFPQQPISKQPCAGCQTATGAGTLLLGLWSHFAGAAIATCCMHTEWLTRLKLIPHSWGDCKCSLVWLVSETSLWRKEAVFSLDFHADLLPCLSVLISS